MDPRKLMQQFWQVAADGEGGGGEPEVDTGEGGEGGEGAPPSMWREVDDGGEGDDPQPEETEDEPEVDGEPPEDEREAEYQRRDAELVERQRQLQGVVQQLQPLIQAQQMLAKGDRAGAMRAMGVDTRELLADQYGDAFLPAQDPPKPEELIEGVDKKTQTNTEQIAELREQLARSEIRGDLRDILDGAEDMPVMKHMAGKGKQVFYNGMIDAALEEQKITGKWPDFRDLLARQEAAYKKRWVQDANEVLQIPGIREALGVEFKADKGRKKGKAQPPAPAPARKPAQPEDEPPPASLTNDLLEESPTAITPKPLKSREEKKQAAVEFLIAARKKREQQEGS